MAKGRREMRGIDSSSMADIAFLLLIFFLVTTTIANDKGLTLKLPPHPDDVEENVIVKFKERNIFKIMINSSDKLLVENEGLDDPSKIRKMVKDHVLNRGANPNLSESPDKAIVSIKANRGTSYKRFIAVYNAAQGAYYDIYAERAGVTNAKWREIASDLGNPENKAMYTKAREGIPMAISIAEPNK